MRRVAINEFLVGCRNALVIDVRSPSEYRHAHLPGAINLPLFNDEERAVVGTQYKQVSREAAIKIGLDYFGPKMRGVVEEVEKQLAKNQHTRGKVDCSLPAANNVFVYCWRGGMRSGAVAWLLNLYGFQVTVLAGGYKAFRHWVLQTNAYPFSLKLIGGYTGSGKTALLKILEQKGELIVDLEALAKHKGSAFGNIGMPQQPTQEMFDNCLAWTLADRQAKATPTASPGEANAGLPLRPIWIEDESQRIGHINIPQPFWQTMRRSPVCFLDIPFEERLQNIVAEYGNLDRERMVAAIQRIAKRLGPLETKTAIHFLEEGQIQESFRILLHYYDKQYRKGLYNRENLSSLLTNITCEKVSVGNADLLSQAQLVS